MAKLKFTIKDPPKKQYVSRIGKKWGVFNSKTQIYQ